MTTPVHIVNAFTENGQGGNPAAVVLDQPDLNAEQRQAIATEIGVSETVFLDYNKNGRAAYKAEFYTPTCRIENCGHATIAAFSLIHEFTGRSFGGFDMELSDPKQPLQNIYTDDERIFLELPASSSDWSTPHIESAGETEIIKALGLRPEHIDGTSDIHIRSLGNRFFLIPVKSAELLRKMRPDEAELKKLSARFNVIGFYPFTRETRIHGRDASARMFAPAYGIAEESATGMAAASLAEYLYKERGLKQSRIMIEQGAYMKYALPSLLEARINTSWFGTLRSIQIGGHTRLKKELTLDL